MDRREPRERSGSGAPSTRPRASRRSAGPALAGGTLPALVPARGRRRAAALVSPRDPARHGRASRSSCSSSSPRCSRCRPPTSGRGSPRGAAQAMDRLVTLGIVAGFGIAVAPLISLLYEVVKRGTARFDGSFFTESARGVIGAGRRRRARDRRHAGDHRRRHPDLRADRDHGRGLPERVRDRPAAQGAHLLRRRDDRHPVDRRRPLRLRALRGLPRARASGSGSSARSRCRC